MKKTLEGTPRHGETLGSDSIVANTVVVRSGMKSIAGATCYVGDAWG